ncbi:MAG: type I restriction enzyme endonuclease domain-containing protein, partial [Sulfurihydrogenibium azorense]
IDECIDILKDEEVREEFITLVRKFNSTLDKLLPDPEALNYTKDLKIINFIKEAARQMYRDDKLSIKDVSNKIREIVEQYLISKGIDPKIPPIPLLSDEFTIKLKQKPPKAKAIELEYAIKEHIEKHFEEDPELYERFSDRLKKILEEYKQNWDLLAEKLEGLRSEIKKGREEEITYGLDPKKEMPFLGLLKNMILGKEPLEKYSQDRVEFLVKLTKDIVEIIKEKIKIVDFWENYTKRKELTGEIISHLLKQGRDSNIFNKRNEIAQRLLELAYHIYGGKKDGN